MSSLLDAYQTLSLSDTEKQYNPNDVCFAAFVVGVLSESFDQGYCPDSHILFPHRASFSEVIDWVCYAILNESTGGDPYADDYWKSRDNNDPFVYNLNFTTHERLVDSGFIRFIKDDPNPVNIIHNLPWRTMALDVLTMPWGNAQYSGIMLGSPYRNPGYQGVPGMWWMESKYGKNAIDAVLNAHRKSPGQNKRAQDMFNHYVGYYKRTHA